MSVMQIYDMLEWYQGPRALGNHPQVARYGARGGASGQASVNSYHPSLPGYSRTYLPSIGVDAPFYWVDDLDLYRGIQHNVGVHRAVKAHLADGGLLEFFHVTRRTVRFMEHMGVEWEQVQSAPLEVVRVLDDKARDRLAAHERGLPNVYSPHRVSFHMADIPQLCREMFDQGLRKLVVRPSNLASGCHMITVTPDTLELEEFLSYLAAMERRGVPRMLVEGFFRGADFSVIFEARHGRQLQLLTWTKQYTDEDGKHLGNLTSPDSSCCTPEGLSQEIWERVQTEVVAGLRPHLEDFQDRGGAGIICCDGMVNESGRWIITEKNVRATAGSIAEMARRHTEALVVVTRNISLPEPMRWELIDQQLGEDSLRLQMERGEQTGIAILNPAAAESRSDPMFTAFGFGYSQAGAEQMIDRVARRFEGRDCRQYYRQQLRLALAAS